MATYQIHPLFFPTTTVFVDDSRPFLENLSLQLDPSAAFALYESATKALEVINSQNQGISFAQECFSRYPYTEEFSSNNCVIDIDIDRIHHEVYNRDRFGESSVIVVDYVMPEMSGLEFCRHVQQSGIKKILLTGKADEKLATRAFNDGLIDRFITKNDEAALPTLNRMIVELQNEYFKEIGAPLVNMLVAESYGFLREPEFAEVFEKIRIERGIVEHYLCCNPEGILMVNSSGVTSLLIVCIEDDMQAHYEISLDQGAPQELLDTLVSQKVIPYFWETRGHYDSGLTHWKSLLHPAQVVEGQRRYFYAIVDNPPPYLMKPILSHHDYLTQLDANGMS
jgi:CheY-like chemotaxis protein